MAQWQRGIGLWKAKFWMCVSGAVAFRFCRGVPLEDGYKLQTVLLKRKQTREAAQLLLSSSRKKCSKQKCRCDNRSFEEVKEKKNSEKSCGESRGMP